MRPFPPAPRASIGVLFGKCRPCAIVGRVVKIVVLAVDRMLRTRFRSHICKKVSKGISPPFTYRNSPASPIGISGIFRVLTAIFHAGPRIIFRTSLRSARSPMTHSRTASHVQFTPQTAAASRVADSQVVRCRNTFSATFTDAVPADAVILFPRGHFPDRRQTFKLLARKIAESDFPYRQWIAVTLPTVVVHGAQPAAFVWPRTLRYRADSHRPHCSLDCVYVQAQKSLE